MKVTFVRKASAIVGWGVLLGSLFSTNLSRGNDDATPAATCPACCEKSMAVLARIPYLNRLFKNTTSADGEVLACDDGFERIGVDFEFEFTAPTTSRPGIRLAEFAQTIRPSTKSSCQEAACCDIEFPCQGDVLIGLSACDVQEQLKKFVGDATLLSALTEVQDSLNDAHSQFVEALAESEIAHQKEQHELKLVIFQLKAKLELQEEREKLKAEIVELRQENTALQMQMVLSQQLQEKQGELTAAKAEIQRLTALSNELQERLAKTSPKPNRTRDNKYPEQPTIYTTR